MFALEAVTSDITTFLLVQLLIGIAHVEWQQLWTVFSPLGMLEDRLRMWQKRAKNMVKRMDIFSLMAFLVMPKERKKRTHRFQPTLSFT